MVMVVVVMVVVVVAAAVVYYVYLVLLRLREFGCASPTSHLEQREAAIRLGFSQGPGGSADGREPQDIA